MGNRRPRDLCMVHVCGMWREAEGRGGSINHIHTSVIHTRVYHSIRPSTHPSIRPTHQGYHSASRAQIIEAACPSPPCRCAGTCWLVGLRVCLGWLLRD